MIKGTIVDWYVVSHASHTSVAGKLYQNGKLVFNHFDTYNPTIVLDDELSCQVSTGNNYLLGNKRDQ
jgi:hypothetical protein